MCTTLGTLHICSSLGRIQTQDRGLGWAESWYRGRMCVRLSCVRPELPCQSPGTLLPLPPTPHLPAPPHSHKVLPAFVL